MQHDIYKAFPKSLIAFPLEKFQIIEIATFLSEVSTSLAPNGSDVNTSVTVTFDRASSTYGIDELQKHFSKESAYSGLEFDSYVRATGIQIYVSMLQERVFMSPPIYIQLLKSRIVRKKYISVY